MASKQAGAAFTLDAEASDVVDEDLPMPEHSKGVLQNVADRLVHSLLSSKAFITDEASPGMTTKAPPIIRNLKPIRSFDAISSMMVGGLFGSSQTY